MPLYDAITPLLIAHADNGRNTLFFFFHAAIAADFVDFAFSLRH